MALFHFKKVSKKETVFNQSNGRKFENSLFAQENSLIEQRDYFWIFWAKRLFSNFLPFDWLKTVSFCETFLKWKRAKTLGTVLLSNSTFFSSSSLFLTLLSIIIRKNKKENYVQKCIKRCFQRLFLVPLELWCFHALAIKVFALWSKNTIKVQAAPSSMNFAEV